MKKLIILICLLFCSVAFAKDKCANRPQNIIREVNATGGTTTYLYTFNPLDTDMMVSLRFRGYYEEILFMPFSFESKNLEKEIVCKDKKFNEGLVVVSSKNDYYLFKPKMIEISYACGDYTKDNKDNYGTMTFVLDYQVFNKRISAVKKPDIFFPI